MAWESVGQKLPTLRTRRGLTLRQLGDRLGVGCSYIGKMERGERAPDVARLVKIAGMVEVSPDRLIRDDLEVDG